MSENKKPSNESRRKILHTGAIAAGVLAAAKTEWAKPVLNSVILPAHAQTSAQTIAELATATGDLSTLVSVLTPGQVDALSGAGPLTVFAPTNGAFAAIQSTVDGLSAAEVEAVVNYHVLSGNQPFSALPETTGTAPNQVGDAITASNGTIYIIDQVLLPPA